MFLLIIPYHSYSYPSVILILSNLSTKTPLLFEHVYLNLAIEIETWHIEDLPTINT